MSEFESFQKIGRLSRDMVITEKLDGTNAQVWIEHVDAVPCADAAMFRTGDFYIKAGSRTRWKTRRMTILVSPRGLGSTPRY